MFVLTEKHSAELST